jgi:hypothetical protein
MSSARYRATYAAPDLPASLLKASVDRSGMWSKAVLSFPCVDLAGDYVAPDGLNFDPHSRDPSIDLEHRRDPSVRGRPVAWARESLSEPGAPYAVEYKALNVAAEGEAPRYCELPIGTSYFDPDCRVSAQVFALVEQDALPAVSLEFKPVPGFFKSLGRSPLENRDAFQFDRADVLRWTICARGVNQGALSLTKSLDPVPQVTRLDRIIADRRVNVGGAYEPLCEVILKALAPAAPAPKRTVVRVESKAMPMPQAPVTDDETQDATAQPDADLDTAAEGAVEDEAPASGGVAAKLAFAQGLSDLCQQYKADMQSSDHPDLRKAADEDIEDIMARAAEIQGRANDHDTLLSGGGKPESDEDTDETDDDEDTESDDTEAETNGDEDEGDEKPAKKKGKPFGKALVLDDEGVVVCRGVYRKSLHDDRQHRFAIKRFPLSALSAAPPPKPVKKAKPEKPNDLSPELQEALAEFQKWQQYAS